MQLQIEGSSKDSFDSLQAHISVCGNRFSKCSDAIAISGLTLNVAFFYIWSGCSTCQQRYRALQVEVIAATPNTSEAQTALQVKHAVRSTAGTAQIDLYNLSRRHDMSRRRINEAEFRHEGPGICPDMYMKYL